MKFLARHSFEHQPFYCEENIWRLIAHDEVKNLSQAQVLFISGLDSSFIMAQQQAGQGELGWIQWDYHVVFAAFADAQWWIFDLDTQLDFPVLAEEYLAASFSPEVPLDFQAYFRRFSAAEYDTILESDRRHMKNPDGTWQAPPPSWPAPSVAKSNVLTLADLRLPSPGEVLSLAQLHRFF